jgi:predicted methyltransferase
MRRILPVVIACAALGCGGAKQTPTSSVGTTVAPAPATDQLALAIDGAQRSPENKARDPYRHPAETLKFFGVGPTQHVVELWPGKGWYTEILAPLLRDQGRLTAVVPTGNSLQPYKDFLVSQPGIYDRVTLKEVTPPEELSFGPDESADAVLTFRNVHGWTGNGYAPQVFSAIFKVLKPGGILGVEEHRANPGATEAQYKGTGYLPEDLVIKLATDAGLVLAEKSEINANPKDTKDYPKGVWTLPPTLQLGDQDREKYLAIGESDRMTLRFKKPEPAR